jgi:ABC-type protease/lipase transport system fused ATPase/permease subunit
VNPLVRLFRRSRALRLLFYASLVPVYVALVFVAINAFANYTKLGGYLALAALVLFAAWAWWWGERRQLQRAGAERADGDGG